MTEGNNLHSIHNYNFKLPYYYKYKHPDIRYLLFKIVTNILKYTNTFQIDSIADVYLPIEVIFDYHNLG